MQQCPEILPGFLHTVRTSSSPQNASQIVSTLQGRPHGAGNVSAGCQCLLNKPISPNSRVFSPHTALTSPLTHIHETGGEVLTLQSCPHIAEVSWRCSSVPKQSSPRTRPVPRRREVLPQQGQHFLHRGVVSSK